MKSRPVVLSIAGFDPSGGAGLLADIKTFEQNKVYGLGVVSALTWQNESEFEKVEWLSVEKIKSQIEILLRKSKIEYAKIGLIENASTLSEIIEFLKNNNPKIKIIWDPVIKASAGMNFHSSSENNVWKKCLNEMFLITPNWTEAIWLTGEIDPLKGSADLSKLTNVYLKGGHNPDKPGYDYVFTHNSQLSAYTFSLRPKSKDVKAKHGSGCVFAAALTALLARGFPLKKASMMAKEYVTRYLTSNPTMLGFHHF
ncbi:MAG: hydroxymethylpyrimidine/phosphomethylpyrimidine kinase [Opitutaceae bacterium]|nr:hydroxymethylpyrimidine/phosphomethylpyrimidine kinase [Cytophagales bacterium]